MDTRREIRTSTDCTVEQEQQQEEEEEYLILGANGYMALVSGDTVNVLIEGCDSSVCDEVLCIKDRLLAGQEITQEDVEFCKEEEARSYFTDDEFAELVQRANASS